MIAKGTTIPPSTTPWPRASSSNGWVQIKTVGTPNWLKVTRSYKLHDVHEPQSALAVITA